MPQALAHANHLSSMMREILEVPGWTVEHLCQTLNINPIRFRELDTGTGSPATIPESSAINATFRRICRGEEPVPTVTAQANLPFSPPPENPVPPSADPVASPVEVPARRRGRPAGSVNHPNPAAEALIRKIRRMLSSGIPMTEICAAIDVVPGRMNRWLAGRHQPFSADAIAMRAKLDAFTRTRTRGEDEAEEAEEPDRVVAVTAEVVRPAVAETLSGGESILMPLIAARCTSGNVADAIFEAVRLLVKIDELGWSAKDAVKDLTR